MKVLEKGSGQQGWSTEVRCTGVGNGDGGCGAFLQVEQLDLYRTFRSCMGKETDTFVTFTCCECGVETDIEGYPRSKVGNLPSRADWRRT
jgi:hypothetical protein